MASGAPRTTGSCAHAAPAHSNVAAAISQGKITGMQRLYARIPAEPRQVAVPGKTLRRQAEMSRPNLRSHSKPSKWQIVASQAPHASVPLAFHQSGFVARFREAM